MSASQVVLLVVAILGVQVLIWIPLGVWLSRRLAECLTQAKALVADGGETALCGPERVRFSRAAGVVAVGNTGVAALTARRVIFVGVAGDPVVIARDEIAEARVGRWFMGSARGGQMQVILRCRDGAQYSLGLRDPSAWAAALGATATSAHRERA